MARPRHDLDVELRSLCPNVYYQGPPKGQMVYPCIMYSLEGKKTVNADNQKYIVHNQYDVKVISRNPDEPLVDTVLEHFENISFDRPYKADSLYHYVYTLYY